MAKKESGIPPKSIKQDKPEDEGRLSRDKINRKIREYRRILQLTRRPTRDEFSTIAKVAALGIVIIGVVGFLIYVGMVQAPANFGKTNATSAQNVTAAPLNASTQIAANATGNATASSTTPITSLPTTANNTTNVS